MARLLPKVRVATTTATASTAPVSAERTGTAGATAATLEGEAQAGERGSGNSGPGGDLDHAGRPHGLAPFVVASSGPAKGEDDRQAAETEAEHGETRAASTVQSKAIPGDGST